MSDEVPAVVLADGALVIAARAAELARLKGQPLSVHHWFLALLERHAPMLEDIASLDPRAVLARTEQALARGELGAEMPRETLDQRACELASQRGAAKASERDVARAVLAALDWDPKDAPPVAVSGTASTPAPSDGNPSESSDKRPRKASVPETPTLEKYGRDLTAEARAGKLPPVVGRELETSLVIETLSRRTKRNPALVGPAGVGKTAIAEGLAQRIAAGQVPEHLRDCRVLAVQPSSLVAGASMAGEFERRMQSVIQEARQPGVILFIDEVHSLIGSGGRTASGDAASILKPALARGDMACMAATTDDEYRVWIEPDGALERRFQPIRVQELTREQSATVLASVRDDLGRLRGVTVPDDVLDWLLTASIRYLRNRFLPDKAIDLLEQTIAHAVTIGRSEVDVDLARSVTERMVGMPVDGVDRVGALAGALARCNILPEDDAEALVARLHVTTRGLDIRPSRPNAVILLADEAARQAPELASLIARELFGAEERVVGIDLGPMANDEDVTRLLGASPGYVGYEDHLPLHDVRQTPWCVLRLDAVHVCHPAIREIVVRALTEGFFTDAQSRRIYLSDAVVILTVNIGLSEHRPIGFGASERGERNQTRDAVARALGDALANQCDIVCDHVPGERTADGDKACELVEILGARYRTHGLELHWDESFVHWVREWRCKFTNDRDWECFLDEHLAPPLLEHVDRADPARPRRIIVACNDDGVSVAEG